MLQSPRELLQAFVGSIRYCPSHRSSYLISQELQSQEVVTLMLPYQAGECSSSTGNYRDPTCVCILLKSNIFRSSVCRNDINFYFYINSLRISMASCITGISEILPIITATLLIGMFYLKPISTN
jgi:hypothetical protein